MKGSKSYIFYILILGALLAVVILSQDKSYDWSVTLAPEDKNPYGAYAINELLPSAFPGKKIVHEFKTYYELKDTLRQHENCFVLSSNFHPDKEDTKVLLEHVREGGTLLVSANYFYGPLTDTLGIDTRDYLFGGAGSGGYRSDTATLHLANPQFDTLQQFYYGRDNVHNYFYRADTAGGKKFMDLLMTVIAKNDLNQPVAIKLDLGKGHLILNCSPMAFTNIYLLSKENNQFVSSLLSYLPARDIYWSEYYQRGRMEAGTPLRFILTNEPLRWAYYIVLFSILLFMVFEAKRRQRIIPVIKPLSNTTLEFVATIGNLYYQAADHKNIAEKKITFFFDQVRRKYSIAIPVGSPEFAEVLARKAGKNKEEVEELLKCINTIFARDRINKESLIRLSGLIEMFWVTSYNN